MKCGDCKAPLEIQVTPEGEFYVCRICGRKCDLPKVEEHRPQRNYECMENEARYGMLDELQTDESLTRSDKVSIIMIISAMVLGIAVFVIWLYPIIGGALKTSSDEVIISSELLQDIVNIALVAVMMGLFGSLTRVGFRG